MTTINLAKQLQQRREAVRKGTDPGAAPSARFNLNLSLDLSAGEKFKLVLMVVGILSIFVGRHVLESYTTGQLQAKQDEVNAVQVELDAAKKKLAGFDSVRREIDAYEIKMREARQKLAIIENVKKNRSVVVRMTDYVVSKMPDSVWLSKLSVDNSKSGGDAGQARVEGYSTSMQLVGDYLDRLEGAIFFPHWELVETMNEVLPPSQALGSSAKSAAPADAQKFQINARIVTL